MEEEKKEEEGCCENKEKYCGHHHHHCHCRHKLIRILILILIASIIFSLGVSVGSHCHSDFGGRNYQRFREMPNRGNWMMNNNEGFRDFGGCGLEEIQTTATCPMQAQIQTQPVQVQTQVVSPVPTKTVTPVK